jgi:hypothetical protein
MIFNQEMFQAAVGEREVKLDVLLAGAKQLDAFLALPTVPEVGQLLALLAGYHGEVLGVKEKFIILRVLETLHTNGVSHPLLVSLKSYAGPKGGGHDGFKALLGTSLFNQLSHFSSNDYWINPTKHSLAKLVVKTGGSEAVFI